MSWAMRVCAALMLAVVLFVPVRGDSTATTAAPEVEHVILLHGWNSSPVWWVVAELQYRNAGFTVHNLALPRNGMQPFDTLINAAFVEGYIDLLDLTNVQVDGHSMGGTLVYELIRVRRHPAIVSAVTRDSNIQHREGNTGLICSPWLPLLIGTTLVPDQCEDSFVRWLISRSAPAEIPVLNISSVAESQPDVDCQRTYDIWHNNFMINVNVTADAVAWARGENPCLAPARDDECPWWMWIFGLC